MYLITAVKMGAACGATDTTYDVVTDMCGLWQGTSVLRR